MVKRLEANLQRGRVVLYSLAIPALFILAMAAVPLLENVKRYALVVVGFSIIIFFHEFGHFIVARLCSVKCEVFSIGIGPRMLGWRKGLGLSFGREPARAAGSAGEPSSLAGLATEGDLPQTSTDEHKDSERVRAVGTAEAKGLGGDCDYRISWLPLGGYVKMLGQDDMDPTKVSADPRAFNNRAIWQRMCIVSAGVIMNIIFAAVVFAVVFQVGVKFPPAKIGPVGYRSPAEEAGLKTGDEVVAIDGKRTRGAFVEFSDLFLAAALARPGDGVKLTYKEDGAVVTRDVNVTPLDNGGSFQAFGVEPMPSLKLFVDDASMELMTKGKPELKVLQAGDSIVKINDAAVGSYMDLHKAVQASRGEAVTLVVHNVDPKVADRTVKTVPELHERMAFLPNGTHYFMGLAPRPCVMQVMEKSAAEAAGLKADDIVLRIGELSNPTMTEFKSTVEKSAGQAIGIEVLRGKERVTVTATPAEEKGKGLLGVAFKGAFGRLDLANVEKGSTAAAAGLFGGEAITAVNDKPVKTWQELIAAIEDNGEKADKLTVTEPTGASVEKTLVVGDALSKPRAFEYALGIRLENMEREQKSTGPVDAVLMGMDHTKKFVLQTYMTLAGLFRQSVSVSNLHGIVGISKIGADVQDKGIIYLFFILAMVSVNLAVANFLPLPIVDGGLFLLLIVEKVRGRPLPMKVQSAIQIVGICVLGGVFILVTYNDILMYLPHK